MGDQSPLEKMGRELKCPICLSLLNSAVSLTCNHVFCNECIVKSMKSVSDCPVCKVPYRRREVRAAPHMDNLVSIYKSMEVSSGINIFVSQNEHPTQVSDGERSTERDSICSGQMNCEKITDAEVRQTYKRKGSKRTNVSNLKKHFDTIVEPSFPAKKRVHVPQYPPVSSTTPLKLSAGVIGKAKDEDKNNSGVLKEKSVQNKKGELALSPFFWLREDGDEEKFSQLADMDQVDLTPLNVPAFSDMRSDDESPTKGEVAGKSGIMDLFDSEMFEWTQRACSPELLSSPVKTQVPNDDNIEETLRATNEEPSCSSPRGTKTTQDTSPLNEEPIISSYYAKNTSKPSRKPKKGVRKAKEVVPENCDKSINEAQVSGADVFLNEYCKNAKKSKSLSSRSALKTTVENDRYLNIRKTRKLSRIAGYGENASESATGADSSASLRAESPNEGEPIIVNDTPATDEDSNLKRTGENSLIHINHRKNSTPRFKKPKLDSAENDTLGDSTIHNQKSDDMTSQRLILLGTHNVTSDMKENQRKQNSDVKSALNSEGKRESRCKKKRKVSFDGVSGDGLVDDCQGGNKVSSEEIHSFGKTQESSGKKNLCQMNCATLRKCETSPSKIQCAFCLSSEDSEASGEMLHYNNGKPVSADDKGGMKMIHSHKNCTEWAPNVYFEDDVPINLEAELSRSRRIRCCLCGLKGAALGCYEKSCRKSFHVPCAKMVAQCRWDTENFVMLCPLHSSSKLPTEINETKKRCSPKVNNSPKCIQIPLKQNDISMQQNWNLCGSSEKLILCCSALSVEEREVVSEFEKLSGVKVLKKWESNVTHVIASVDETGACKRTLKVLKGILEGKWILNIEWVKACMKAMKHIPEEQYEITMDVHGTRDGPRHGRMRFLDKQLKLFDGLKFYFMGEFTSSYKGYLQDLVIAAGGAILNRKPILGDQEVLIANSCKFSTFVTYSLELDDKLNSSKKNMILGRRQTDADVLANSTGAKAVSSSWILNSVAACKLQSLS